MSETKPAATLTTIAQYLMENGHAKGGEPEYVEVKTPLGDDPKGWMVVLQWMHHDGTIPDVSFRGQVLEECLQQMYDYLVQRDQAQQHEPSYHEDPEANP